MLVDLAAGSLMLGCTSAGWTTKAELLVPLGGSSSSLARLASLGMSPRVV